MVPGTACGCISAGTIDSLTVLPSSHEERSAGLRRQGGLAGGQRDHVRSLFARPNSCSETLHQQRDFAPASTLELAMPLPSLGGTAAPPTMSAIVRNILLASDIASELNLSLSFGIGLLDELCRSHPWQVDPSTKITIPYI